MNGSRLLSQLVSGGLEDPMIPAHSQPPTKRKGTDEGNPLNNAVKKVRRETSTKAGPSNKRKLTGEEQPGGLVIVRAPSQGSHTLHIEPLPPEARASSRPPSVPPQHHLPSQQPSKRFRSDGGSSRSIGRIKDRQLYASPRADPEVDEDVRLMQSETDTLRRRSQAAEQAAGAINAEFQFPALKSHRQPPQMPSGERGHDTSYPIPLQETPQIERNKLMREGQTQRRRSSVSRGKRISSSFETSGVISHPHTSVSGSSFYKHIDCDLPEPQRARQLLIWCSNRAMNELADQTPHASSSIQKSTNSGKDPPPLSSDDMRLMKRVEESVIRMLAEKKIDTNVYGMGGAANGDSQKPMKENEQNVKNRAREVRFNAHILRSKTEADAWKELVDFYNAYQATVASELDKRRQELASSKVKGKQRASVDDLNDWDVSNRDIPNHYLETGNLDLARSIIKAESDKNSPLRSRMDDLEHKMDRLHTFANSALQTTHVSEADLDQRFALLSISLASRSQPALSSLPSSSTALSSYLPSSLARPPQTTDPQDLLRALSRIDADRPQTQVGDAARRAVREVQRANDSSSGIPERRLTGVPPPTPRKPPGTPRRATTPGRGR